MQAAPKRPQSLAAAKRFPHVAFPLADKDRRCELVWTKRKSTFSARVEPRSAWQKVPMPPSGGGT
jgi:hypothetical protein